MNWKTVSKWLAGIVGLLALLFTIYRCQKPLNPAATTPGDEVLVTDSIVNVPAAVKSPQKGKKIITDTIATVRITLVGDLMCHKPQINNAKKSDSTFDFNPSFEHVKPYFLASDYTIGNLETTFAGPKVPYAGYPAFNSPDVFAEALKNAGFDLLVTANNHSMDTGEKGLLRTLKILHKYELEYTGTFESQKDHDKLRIVQIKGIKMAVLNYTYGTNGSYPQKKHEYMLNRIDSVKICTQIAEALALGADIILVYYHFGIENQKEPTKDQLKAAKWAVNAGAKVVIGAHPHVIGPVEYIPVPASKNKDTAFVAYSLGNFISNQYWRYSDAGVILYLVIEKNTRTNYTRFVKAKYVPTWVYRGQNPKHKQHIVLPAKWAFTDSLLPHYITPDLKEKMQQAYQDTYSIISKN